MQKMVCQRIRDSHGNVNREDAVLVLDHGRYRLIGYTISKQAKDTETMIYVLILELDAI